MWRTVRKLTFMGERLSVLTKHQQISWPLHQFIIFQHYKRHIWSSSPNRLVKEVLPFCWLGLQLGQRRHRAVISHVYKRIFLSVVDVAHDLKRGVWWVTESNQNPVFSEQEDRDNAHLKTRWIHFTVVLYQLYKIEMHNMSSLTSVLANIKNQYLFASCRLFPEVGWRRWVMCYSFGHVTMIEMQHRITWICLDPNISSAVCFVPEGEAPRHILLQPPASFPLVLPCI